MKSPKSKDEYDAAADLLHLEVGRIIDEWSRIEQWMHDVFVFVTSHGGAITPALSAAFWSVQGVESKLVMITAAVNACGIRDDKLGKMVGKWKSIKKKVQRKNRKRNKFAHGCIVSPDPVVSGPPTAFPVWVPYYDQWGYSIYKLTPPEARSEHMRPYEEMRIEDLRSIRREFMELQQELSVFIATFVRSSS